MIPPYDHQRSKVGVWEVHSHCKYHREVWAKRGFPDQVKITNHCLESIDKQYNNRLKTSSFCKVIQGFFCKKNFPHIKFFFTLVIYWPIVGWFLKLLSYLKYVKFRYLIVTFIPLYRQMWPRFRPVQHQYSSI